MPFRRTPVPAGKFVIERRLLGSAYFVSSSMAFPKSGAILHKIELFHSRVTGAMVALPLCLNKPSRDAPRSGSLGDYTGASVGLTSPLIITAGFFAR
jgi:hypothetical protein